MSSIFSDKDRDLLVENLKLGNNPALTDAPGSGSCMAYSSVSFSRLSDKARDYFTRIIGETNRPPKDGDIISITWSREWGHSFYVFSEKDGMEWYVGADIEKDDVLEEILKERITPERAKAEDYFKRVFEAYSEFSDRIEACEVWAGLDRPWIALGDVYGNIRNLLSEFSKEDIKVGAASSSQGYYSGPRLRLKADKACREMDANYDIDYLDLIKRVMGVESMSKNDKYIIVTALEHDYIKVLQDGVKVLSDIYEAGTGNNLLENYLHKWKVYAYGEADEEKTWVNIPNELGLGDEDYER